MSHTCHRAAASHNGGLVQAGKKGTIHVSAKAMNVTWANDARFWKWIRLPKNELPEAFSKDDTSFDTTAELIQVNWLEARGSVALGEHKPGRYEIIYHVRFKVDAFGWSKSPVTFEVITPGGDRRKKSVMLEPYRRRSDEWHEIHGGELKTPGTVEFAMSQVESHGWKGGMILGGVSLRPK
ncbi:Protein PHLOEM protein 2-LIKE [Musa troglodytarum]|uniref:Protein PHLOEM protein 2-LIKE n=1 Tax=Musa troglodytarum TaxID=320322 RepID=A0A9E7G4A4_9LILI|nr:Protein PHLOEM protein 2-LIKE [Musa troglodytarum]